ncbi:MAG: hypothetical protein ACM3YE_17215 [Bacteroidota bacterium]
MNEYQLTEIRWYWIYGFLFGIGFPEEDMIDFYFGIFAISLRFSKKAQVK